MIIAEKRFAGLLSKEKDLPILQFS